MLPLSHFNMGSRLAVSIAIIVLLGIVSPNTNLSGVNETIEFIRLKLNQNLARRNEEEKREIMKMLFRKRLYQLGLGKSNIQNKDWEDNRSSSQNFIKEVQKSERLMKPFLRKKTKLSRRTKWLLKNKICWTRV